MCPSTQSTDWQEVKFSVREKLKNWDILKVRTCKESCVCFSYFMIMYKVTFSKVTLDFQ